MKEEVKQEFIKAYDELIKAWDKLSNITCGDGDCKECPIDKEKNVPCQLGYNFFNNEWSNKI